MIDAEEVFARIEAGDIKGVAALMVAGQETERRALAGQFKDHQLAHLPEPLPTGDYFTNYHANSRALDEHRDLLRRRKIALAVACVAGLPRATDVVTRLRDTWLHIDTESAESVVRVLQAPGRPSIAAVATSMAQKMRPTTVDQWPVVSALLDAAQLPVPPTEATLTGWIQQQGRAWSEELIDRLRADPRTPDLLPHLFAIPRLGTHLDEEWPKALTMLAADDDATRRTILDGCLLRLRAGDRPASIKSMADLHRALAPTLEECAEHRQEYLAMLSSPPVAVADLALAALRVAEAGGRAEPELIVEAAYAVLPRKEKKLVRAMLEWIGAVLTDRSDPDLYEALLAGLGNEAVDLAEQTLHLAAAHLTAYGPEPLAQAATILAGDLRRQAQEVLRQAGATVEEQDSLVLLPAPAPVAAMPPSIASLGELAGETAAANRWETFDPILMERVFDALTRFAYGDRPALAAILTPMLDEYGGWLVDRLIYGIVHRGPRPPRHQVSSFGGAPLSSPAWTMINARVTELTGQLYGTPPPALLATPATVDGHVDPHRVLDLLTNAESDGWQPGPYDLAQALLRLPREVDAPTRAAAERLRSPAGRQFAGWLRDGGLPDPAAVAISSERPVSYNQPRLRRTVAIEAFAHPPLTVPDGLLSLPATSARERAYGYLPDDESITMWPMILPGHRELVAAHALPLLTMAADGDYANQLHVLPAVAAGNGPFGPAMALCLAYGLAAGRPAGRMVTVDAFVSLAARNLLDGTIVGHELGMLEAAQVIVLKRVVDSLQQALRAGAASAVWDLTRTLLPTVLTPPRPAAGTPDLLMIAASAAATTQATDDIPEVRTIAAQGGATRLATEAARLVRTLENNRAAADAS
ncbi:DUF6493 family protein [Actinoplanes sp. L3-i22]|uniref:DUF7825 domain-containing protein n=1 Tax=Actinoplanes sp. L3-i22 TaxID=2836373 RepID=UPI001C769E01|nr:DUF6493 family protein [Actinoplanes sp. L3-i22]BCY08865.1 hypothetical protein L3i22_039530 [Actinoplanes sp. L3-i22]